MYRKFISNFRNARRRLMMRKDEKLFGQEFLKKAILSYPPRTVTLAVTSACTNKCTFCAYHSSDATDGKSKVYEIPYKISYEDIKRMIDTCYKGRVPKVHICATGDPFCHPDIKMILDYHISVYGETSVQTNFAEKMFSNGKYLDYLSSISEKISYITTDIMSGIPEVHDSLKVGTKFDFLFDCLKKISVRAKPKIKMHLILTRHNFKGIDLIIDKIHSSGVNADLEVVNLHPYGFNEITMPDSVYTSDSVEMTRELDKAKKMADSLGVKMSVPLPFDLSPKRCGAFWSRFQIWPVSGCDGNRLSENIIVGACNAVVLGNLNSLGYFFDYDNIMKLWNNSRFVEIRNGLLNGVYPDEACVNCQSFSSRKDKML